MGEQALINTAGHPRVAEYVLTRELEPASAFFTSASARSTRGGVGRPSVGALAPRRMLALHSARQTSHVAYCFGPVAAPAEFRRAVELASRVRHAHLLPVDECLIAAPVTEGGTAGGADGWVITPFAGDVDGVRPLSRLLKEKSGQMTAMEAERALVQLFEALQAVHQGWAAWSGARCGHGPIQMDHVLVDRHGSLSIELYGLARLLLHGEEAEQHSASDHRADVIAEVRSVVEIGYELITGLKADVPLVPARRMVRGLDRRWDDWFKEGLEGEGGYESADVALARLPGNQPPPEPAGWAAWVKRVQGLAGRGAQRR